MFQELRRLEISDNTLIIVTSDQGEEYLEHGGIYHGETRSAPCGLFDIFPTAIGQTDFTIPDSLDGVDLFSGDYTSDRIIPASGIRSDDLLEFSQVAVLKERLKLIWGIHTEAGMQFDLANDPGETHPLPVLRTLVSAAEFYWCTPPKGNPDVVTDAEITQELKDLGYIR